MVPTSTSKATCAAPDHNNDNKKNCKKPYFHHLKQDKNESFVNLDMT